DSVSALVWLNARVLHRHSPTHRIAILAHALFLTEVSGCPICRNRVYLKTVAVLLLIRNPVLIIHVLNQPCNALSAFVYREESKPFARPPPASPARPTRPKARPPYRENDWKYCLLIHCIS